MEDVDEKSLDCVSVGFLLNETEEHVTIAQNYGLKPEQVCNLITIPKCSIRNTRELKEEYAWKPSEEMLEALYKVIPENKMEISEDEMLLDKLYQGLKYGRVLNKK